MPRSKTKSKLRETSTELRFIVTPPSNDELLLRQSIQNALDQTFGISRAFTYFDFMRTSSDEMTIQVTTL